MVRYFLLLLLIFLAGAQLFTLFFGRRKKRAVLKRFLLTCIVCGLVYVTPFIFSGAVDEVRTALPMDISFIKTDDEGTYPLRAGEAEQIIYYNQEDPLWGEKNYGPVDKIQDTGCGPTVLAMVVSTFTENTLTPEEMCQWAYENGYCSIGSGSYHGLIGEGLEHYGISNQTTNSAEMVKTALEAGRPVIALMGEGHFTKGGHFILLCDIDDQGKVSVADPKSVERTQKKWDLDLILEEAKSSPVTGGAFWIVEV